LKGLEGPRKNRLEIRLEEYCYRMSYEFRKGIYKTVQITYVVERIKQARTSYS